MSHPQNPRTRFSVGLTGGIGSGKTTVANLFAQRGVAIIDTDELAHALTAAGGAAMPAIRSQFGAAFLTDSGAMDRPKIRELVFSEPSSKARLEAILHPLIRIETERLAAAAQGPYLMFVVPLLVESGNWKQRVNRVLVVDCPEALQVARVGARSGLSEAQVHAILAAQVSRQERLAAADDVIVNVAGTDELAEQVDRLHQLYLSLATQQQ